MNSLPRPFCADPSVLASADGASTSAKIHEILRNAIIVGALAPGQTVSEIEISRKFATSRQPVREAFIMLAQEKLIEARPNRGTYIRKISLSEVIDACFVREVIELAIVREVTLEHDAKLMKALRKNLAAQKKVVPDDSESFLKLDEQFHHLLAQHARRDFAWEITERVKAQLNRVRYLTYGQATPKAMLVAEHTEIVDAIGSGDAALAEKKMQLHFGEIYRTLPIVAEKNPAIFTG